MLDVEPEAPEVPLTAAPLAPAAGVPVTPVVCEPSPAVGVIGTMPEALSSPQPETIAAIHRVAILNACALFIARPWPLVWRAASQTSSSYAARSRLYTANTGTKTNVEQSVPLVGSAND
jgi:hypothetical protein